jgi:cobalt-zinc-cadmium efflux system membrane fusion protein
MKRKFPNRADTASIRAATVRELSAAALVLVLVAAFLAGCNAKGGGVEAGSGAPPPAVVEHEGDETLFKVDHPDRFPLAKAIAQVVSPQLPVTGVVSADISRNVPVISLASGRIIEVHTRLGDEVTKGQLLMRVQSADLAQTFSDYRQAVADEELAKTQLDRAKILYEKGAIARKDLEVAEDTEKKAVVTVETTLERLKVLGADPSHPNSVVDVFAPISGVISDQQVTQAAGTQGLASPNAFTISDLSHVWILCDVYENDLHFVRVGEYADIRLNAYPDRVFRGRIGNIGPILDPNIRTAKVRLELENPGVMRFGMFVTATFHGEDGERVAVVPAAAVLHLHDRDWIYVPAGDNQFRRVEVTAGDMLPGNMQVIKSGIHPGDQVVAQALVLENTLEQ